jgi:hypothetical protein
MLTIAPVGCRRPDVRRCASCGDRLGVYEPIYYASGQHLVRTSLAADPDLLARADRSGARLLHAACYERERGLFAGVSAEDH